jgi:dsDNA-specific endonuclease/ATPase MutS2
MNIDDLWIGDFLLIKSKGLIGQFDGKDGKLIVVNVDGEKMKVSLSDVEPAEDPYLAASDDSEKMVRVDSGFSFEGNKIDLHIEVLNQNMVDALPERIRDYQVAQCKVFLEYAKGKRYATIEIIHGKGSGLLKKEIHHLLKMDSSIQFILEKNNGGSTEAWIKTH